MLDENNTNENAIFEEEKGNDNVKIEVPFNPDLIKVEYEPYSIGLLIQDYKLGAINTDTEFQRKAGLWDIKKKSRFIESLILNLPIPSFYFSENDTNTWDVIDGLQRITTIKEFFIKNEFKLQDLEFLGSEFDGKGVSDFSSILRTKLERYKLTVHIIRKGTPIDVKYNIFRRVNTGGLVLTQQEIRHALNQGKPAELLADLVRSEDIKDENGLVRTRYNLDKTETVLSKTSEGLAFVKATDSKIQSSRMEDRDFANRFLAFYLLGYENYKPDLDNFLNLGLAKVKELTLLEIQKIKDDFRCSMSLAFDVFGDDAFRKRFHKHDRKKPINKALFEVISVHFAYQNEVQRDVIREKKYLLIDKLTELQLKSDGRFLASITSGTAQRESVEQRHYDFKKLINEVLYDK